MCPKVDTRLTLGPKELVAVETSPLLSRHQITALAEFADRRSEDMDIREGLTFLLPPSKQSLTVSPLHCSGWEALGTLRVFGR